MGSSSPLTEEPSGTSAQVSQVASNCPARLMPSLNNASSLVVIVAPVVGFLLIPADTESVCPDIEDSRRCFVGPRGRRDLPDPVVEHVPGIPADLIPR